ncbi:helix-turn-helix transcriptional regulator [Nocardiopsis sp. NPDC049922]|uniref:helix-turn-helix domain-containing protein n=1 Tax=Nocardiopsis sp. NPDC049922 TaxID=3155157 RepID=UPI0033F1A842
MPVSIPGIVVGMARTKADVDPMGMSRFARELEHLRIRAGLTQTELGALAGYSHQSIGAVERLDRHPTPEFARKVDEALDAGGALLDLLPRKNGSRRRYLREYVDLEFRALTIDQFQPQVVPALLQTEEYARADLAASVPPLSVDRVEELATARLKRGEILRRSQPPMAQFVIDEGALRRVIGGPEVMRRQWEAIADLAQAPAVTVQVLRFADGAHPLTHGACTLLGMTRAETLLFVETTAGGQVITDPPTVSTTLHRFGALRAIASSPSGSLAFVRELIEKGS